LAYLIYVPTGIMADGCMLLYACEAYEPLYGSFLCIKIRDTPQKRHVTYKSNRKTVKHKHRGKQKMVNNQKEVQVKLMKGLLDLIILQFLSTEPMHGYQIITKIRKSFGVYFGPSTIYPLLGTLEHKGYVSSEWNMASERPRKVYKLTNEGQGMLSFTEDSLNLICRKISVSPDAGMAVEQSDRATLKPMIRRIGAHQIA
jgi:DNA-binding PadR family transcriptional regulator